MGDEHIGSRQHLELINALIGFDVVRQGAELFLIHILPARDDDVGIHIPECRDTLPIEIRTIIDDRAQRDIDQRTRLVLLRRKLREHGRSDKIIMAREALGIRLEPPRGIDDGIGLIIVRHQCQSAFDLVAVGAQGLELLTDLRQPEDHVLDLGTALLHVF